MGHNQNRSVSKHMQPIGKHVSETHSQQVVLVGFGNDRFKLQKAPIIRFSKHKTDF